MTCPPSPPDCHTTSTCPAQAPSLGVASPAKVVRNAVQFVSSCTGAASQTCSGQATITLVEKLDKHGHIGGIARARSKTVLIGSVRYAIAGGRSATITVTLNKTGKALLTRFKHVRATLTVSTTTNGKLKTLTKTKVTFKQLTGSRQ
jgi:hypothetical protein